MTVGTCRYACNKKTTRRGGSRCVMRPRNRLHVSHVFISHHIHVALNPQHERNAWLTELFSGLMRRSQIDGICNGCLMGRWARDSHPSMVLSIYGASSLSYDMNTQVTLLTVTCPTSHHALIQGHAIKHLGYISRKCLWSLRLFTEENEHRRAHI